MQVNEIDADQDGIIEFPELLNNGMQYERVVWNLDEDG